MIPDRIIYVNQKTRCVMSKLKTKSDRMKDYTKKLLKQCWKDIDEVRGLMSDENTKTYRMRIFNGLNRREGCR